MQCHPERSEGSRYINNYFWDSKYIYSNVALYLNKKSQ